MRPNGKVIGLAKSYYVIHGKKVRIAQMLEVSLLGVGTVLRLEKETAASNN